jgi:uncharacterized protein (DUF1015 family)
MADIRPFVATRYAIKEGVDLSRLLTPPYDVIDAALQQELLERDQHNLVRIDFGKVNPEDTTFENHYSRAGSLWHQWKKDGVLAEDNKKSFYVYEQEFVVDETQALRRRGFFAAVHLEDFSTGGIRAHEHTFDGPKADRFRLMRATNANLSPIFCIYDDPEKATDKLLDQAIKDKKPIEAIMDGVTHRLWQVCDGAIIKGLQERMAAQVLFIADGHHRYETSLAYQSEMRQALSAKKRDYPFDYTMMFLANIHDDGMIILPTHRVLSKETCMGADEAETLEDVKEYFDVKELKIDCDNFKSEARRLMGEMAEAGKKTPSFIMLLPKGQGWLLSLKPGVDLAEMIGDDETPASVQSLDVTILHDYLINQGLLGNPEIELDDQDVTYVKDAADVLGMMRANRYGAAFLMNPTRIEQVCEVAKAGLRMPHKSTYFYPKVVTGMVMRDLDSPW